MPRRLLIATGMLWMLVVPMVALADDDGTGGPDGAFATMAPTPTAISEGSGGPVDVVSTAVVTLRTIPDGTGGAPMLVANIDACDRAPLAEAVIAASVEVSQDLYFGAIEPMLMADLDGLEPVDPATFASVQGGLIIFQACVAKYGPAGGYAFLEPGMTQTELIYLGIFDPGLFDGIENTSTPEPLAAGFRPEAMAPYEVYHVAPGRVLAVVPALQPGTEQTVIAMAAREGRWSIVSVAPLVERADDGGGGGGP